MRSAVKYGLAAAILVCGLGAARAQEHRVCIDFDIPAEALVDVRVGYYPSVSDRQYADWFERQKDKHWLLRVMRASMGYATNPDVKVHPFRSLSVDLNLQDGALVPSIALWRQFSSPNGGPPEPVPPGRCRKYGMVTKESLYWDRVVVQVLEGAFRLTRKVPATMSTRACVDNYGGRVPARRADLDFDGFEACEFTDGSGRPSAMNHIAYQKDGPDILRCDALYCRLEFALDGWDLQVGFKQERRDDWRAFKRAALDYLNQHTLSRTPAATE